MCVLPNRGLPPMDATGLYQPFGAAAGFCAGVHHTDEVADYQFNGNAIDAGGHNHGSITGGVSFVSDRNGVPNAAALFNGVDHFITVQAPFPNADTEFTIAVWLKPSSVDNSWHGFVGYHADLAGRRHGLLLPAPVAVAVGRSVGRRRHCTSLRLVREERCREPRPCGWLDFWLGRR